jgi:chitodextrinase
MRLPRGRRAAATFAAVIVAMGTGVALLPQPATASPAVSGFAERPRPDRTPPTAPTNVRVTGVAETSVSLAWNPSTDNSGSVRYVIEMVDRHFSFGPFQGTSATVNDSTLLPPNTAQTLRVRAYDAAYNYSAPSNVVTALTRPDVQAPTTPGNVQVVSATPHTVALRWSPSTDNIGWPSDVRYRVSMGQTVLGWSTSLNGAAVPFELRHLPRGAVLTFDVQAVDRSNNLSVPARITVDLPDSADATPPAAPVLVSAVDAEYGEAKLTWLAAADDTSAATGIEYEFLVDGRLVLFNGREFAYPVVRGATTGWAPALNAPGTFSFAVRAVDAAGNVSPPSNAIAVTVTSDGY